MRSRRQQRGYLLITVVVALFLLATVAVMLTHGSAINANSSGMELEADRAEYVTQAGMQHALWRAGNNACMGSVTIPTTTLGADSYTAAITGAAAGTAYTLTVDQDAWIRSDDVTKNNGTTASNHLRFEGGNVEQILTRFDLSTLAANAQINSATAWFHLKAGEDHPEGPITVRLVTSDWAETTVTWETFDGAYDSATLGTIPAQDAGDVWVAVNLTGQTQAWMNGQPNYGILFDSTAEGIHTEYVSREGAANEQPYLEVVVGSGSASPVAIQVAGTLANGNTRTLNRPISPTYQPPVIHTFRPDAADSEDAEIWAQGASNNYGDAAEAWVSSASNDTTRSLLRFTLSAIPTESRILGATLILHRQSGSGADQPVSAHRITNSWSEDSVTWNHRESGTNWDTAGGDFDSQAVATTQVGPLNEPYEWDIMPLVQAWVDGSYPNYGVAMIAAIDGMAGERFYTSDQATPDIRPSLTISYACECGSTCMAAQGSGNVLMPVSNVGNPTTNETQRIDLLESWGYVVDTINEQSSQGAYDTAIAANDIVFVPSTANPADVGTKLTNATIGVVSENGALNDELGIASSQASPVGSSINIGDTDHFITRPFTTGQLDIYTAAMSGNAVSGTAAPDLRTLGDWSGASGLVALDKGAMTSSGGTAASRRVLVPIGDNVDMSRINNNGRLIMQRAIEWAAMLPEASSANELLFVVGNESSPTTEESAYQSIIEGWGYTIELIDDDASQAEFDAAAANNDVAFITNDITASRLSTKLVNATIGVVTSEDNLSDEFGLSSSIDWDSGDHIGITDNTHYITSPFAEEKLTILSTSESLAHVNGTLSPDLGLLAFAGTGYGVVTLEAGATHYAGGTVAGRRVQLPWGGSPSLEPNDLTADGVTILKRAIKWGAGAGPGAGNRLLFVVTDAASPVGDEIERQTLVESWGYIVTRISDDDSQANFDSAAAVNDLAYISADALYNNVGVKLADATIGVAFESYQLHDEFGMSPGGIALANLQSITITDNGHYITSPFSGSVNVVTANTQLSSVSSYAADTQLGLLASIPGYVGAIATFDTGDLDHWGATVAGRRVKLPWGSTDWGFNVSTLTADGQNILKRSLEWIAGANYQGPIAHWKLDDGAGTTAIDSEGGHDGTLVNGPAWVAGQLGGALSFDGSNDYIDVSSMNPMSYDDLTISAWYKSADSSLSDDEYIYMHGDGYIDAITFGPSDDDSEQLRLALYIGDIADRHYGTTDIVDQQWHHLVAVRTSGRIILYVDNVKEADEADAYAGITVTVDGDGPFIGDYPGGTEQIHGILDDVRLFDRGLTEDEIAALFTAGGGGGGGGGPDANLGFDTIFPSSQDFVRRKQIATRVTLLENGTATSITAYVGKKDDDVRYAIYSDVAGEPGALLAESDNEDSPVAMEWFTIDIPETALTAGTYWLALSFDHRDQEYRYENGGQTRYNNNRATNNGYTATWGSSSASYTRNISIYATYTPD